MPPSLQFTGERYVPGACGEIAYEHAHRYVFARRFVSGRRALEAACGEGYGAALLATAAVEVTGVDVDVPTIVHARATYGARPNVRFVVGAVTALPFAAASFDAVICFETIEHLGSPDQSRMLAEFARVLAPDGVLVLSSPNKRRYSDEREYQNPYHAREPYRRELARLLEAVFPHHCWFHQQPLYASALWAEAADHGDECEAWCGGADTVEAMTATDGLYYIVVAAAAERALPRPGLRLSLYTDRADSERARAEANAAAVLRLDALLKERDAANATLTQRQSEFAKAGAAVASLQHELKELEAALAAQERIIAYQQSLRGWLRAPLGWALRARRHWLGGA